MQYPREMYGKGGLTSLREARNLLEKYAPEGESLAYINEDEAKYLKYMGGAGIPVNSSGVPSYFIKRAFKAITKPIAKVLDKQEFWPLKTIVYGMTGVILLVVLSAVLLGIGLKKI